MCPWYLLKDLAQQHCVHWVTSGALQTAGTFHLERVQSIQVLSSGNKTINIIAVGRDNIFPITFHQLLRTSLELVANPEFILHKSVYVRPNSQIEPCAAISILATGANLSCYCQR